ncbi:MAG TPA: hypothetical protein VNU92_05895 [Edaphobacter sp.]|jgi:hypothetical protein|nr:hypothetical protein [Edaphobacter sp.]
MDPETPLSSVASKVRCPRIRLTANFYRLDHSDRESSRSIEKPLQEFDKAASIEREFLPQIANQTELHFCDGIDQPAHHHLSVPAYVQNVRRKDRDAFVATGPPSGELGPVFSLENVVMRQLGQLARNLVESETNALCLAMAVPL